MVDAYLVDISGSEIELTNYQVRLTIPAGISVSDWDQLDFYQDATQLPYWHDSNRYVWVKIPTIPTVGTQITMYVGQSGNHSAASVFEEYYSGEIYLNPDYYSDTDLEIWNGSVTYNGPYAIRVNVTSHSSYARFSIGFCTEGGAGPYYSFDDGGTDYWGFRNGWGNRISVQGSDVGSSGLVGKVEFEADGTNLYIRSNAGNYSTACATAAINKVLMRGWGNYAEDTINYSWVKVNEVLVRKTTSGTKPSASSYSVGSAPEISDFMAPLSVLEETEFEVSAIVTDADGDLSIVKFTFNEVEYEATKFGSLYSAIITAPTVGTYTSKTLEIIATDEAGNERSQQRTVVVLGSTNAPRITSYSVPGSVNEGKTFDVSVVVTDADGDLDHVSATWNSSTDNMSVDGDTYSKTLTAPNVDEDTIYTLTIIAYDSTGNTATVSFSINVLNIRELDTYSYIDICCNKYVSQGDVYAIRTDGRLFKIENSISPTAIAIPSGSDGWYVRQIACGDEFQIVRAEVLWS